MPTAYDRYFHHVRIHVRPNGERFPTIFDITGVPAHYPTCVMLDLRAKNAAALTMESVANDLLHLGQVLIFEDFKNFHQRLEDGDYLDDYEIEIIAERLGLETAMLRKLNDPKVTTADRNRLLEKAPTTVNQTKARRITSAARYIDLVARIGEAKAGPAEKRRRAPLRKEMINFLKELRPKGRSSRTRSAIRADDLAKVVAFVATGDPAKIWSNERLRSRKWAIVSLLVFGGLRNSELRQLRASDIDTNRCVVEVHRRPDDPDDPRIREPNAKTMDRIVPISSEVANRLDDYLLGFGADMAEFGNSPFAFLSDGNNSRGQPISSVVVSEAVEELGAHLGVQGLHPHALRSAWIQQLVDWSVEKGIPPAELDRFANYMGGWSYFSKSASHYRGDHLTQKAFDAGLLVEKER